MQRRQLIFLTLATLLASVGFYLLYLLYSAPSGAVNDTRTQQAFVAARPVVSSTDTLYIPKINVEAPVRTGDVSALANGGIWHRAPENGSPEKGGNFVLAGHRYVFSLTPDHVKQQSVLYNLDRLQIGDTFFVDYKNKRYHYTVNKTLEVKPHATYIEQKTAEPRLTLYSCTLQGANDGRIVVIATPTIN